MVTFHFGLRFREIVSQHLKRMLLGITNIRAHNSKSDLNIINFNILGGGMVPKDSIVTLTFRKEDLKKVSKLVKKALMSK